MKVTVWLHYPKGMTAESARTWNPGVTVAQNFHQNIWAADRYDTYRCEIDVPLPDEPVVARGVAVKEEAGDER